MTELQNLGQILAGTLMIVALALPTGFLTLRVMRLARDLREWMLLPAAVVVGLLVLPLAWYIVASVNHDHLPHIGRLAVWLALNAILFLIDMLIPPAKPPDADLLHGKTGRKWTRRLAYGGVVLVGLAALWITLHPMTINGTPYGKEGMTRMNMFDWSKHIYVTAVIAQSDTIPPPNPFLSNDPEFSYHYFSYLIPATVSYFFPDLTTSNLSIAQAGLIVLLLPFIVFVYGRAVGLSTGAAFFAAFVIGLVSGLDYLYILEYYYHNQQWWGHIDNWTDHGIRRINGLPDAYIWGPLHVLGVEAFVLSLWFIRRLLHPSNLIHLARVMGLALVMAALAGTSILTWFGLGVGLVAFGVVEVVHMLRKRAFSPLLPAIIAAGLASLALNATYVMAQLGEGRAGDAPIVLQVSPTRPGIQYGGIFTQLFGNDTLTYTLDFPFQMIPEFGVMLIIGLVGLWLLRKSWGEKPELRLWAAMLPVFFFIILAVREGRLDAGDWTSNTNNYAPRMATIAMAILSIGSGFWWMQRRRTLLWRSWILRGLVLVMIVVGLCTAYYEPVIMRRQRGYVPPDNAALYTWLNENLTANDIYQLGSPTSGHNRSEPIYLVERRAAYPDTWRSRSFASHPSVRQEAIGILSTGYNSTSAELAAAAFREMGITHVVTSRSMVLVSTDDILFSRYFTPVYHNETYIVYRILN